jgi:acyl-CoA thioester hydrolase
MSAANSPQLGRPLYKGNVRPEWIDANDHMNVAYYVLAFDLAVDSLWEQFGITEQHIREQQSSTFAVESHVTWQGEMNLGDAFVVTGEILAYDAKRIHQFQRMYHLEKGYLAATCEWMNLHIDLRNRCVAPWPDDVLAAIAGQAGQQGNCGLPDELGQAMKIKNAIFSVEDYA